MKRRAPREGEIGQAGRHGGPWAAARCVMLLGLGLAMLLVGGCGAQRTGKAVSIVAPDVFGVGEELASQLVQNRRRSFGIGERVVPTSLVDLDQLHATSRFGRSLTEAMATQLFRRGYSVVEIRKMPAVLIQNDAGELILSRDAALLASQHEADLVLAGTYSLTPRSVIVNLRLLAAGTGEVVSVAGLELARSHTVNALLADRGPVDAQLSGLER